MSATIIDGKAFAAGLRARIAAAVAALKRRMACTPGLAVVLVGDDPASQVYVRNKAQQTVEAGHALRRAQAAGDDRRGRAAGAGRAAQRRPARRRHPGAAAAAAADRRRQRSSRRSIPHKDVDGFHPINAGRLATGRPGFVPCTPLGCLMLLQDRCGDARRARRRRRRPLEHRRQADGAAAARRELHRHHRPLPHPRPAGRVPRAPTSSSPPSAGPRWSGATG